MKYWLILLALFSLGSLADEWNLNTYQNNQVQQVQAQVYYIYEPELNTPIREAPSLDSKVIALLNNNDRNFSYDTNWKDYKYTKHNDEWMSVSSFADDSLVGYSHRSLFKHKVVLEYNDSIETPYGTFELEFIGHPFQPHHVEETYRPGNYWYGIKLNDKLLLEKGWRINKTHAEHMVKQEGEFMPTKFHTLNIQDKKVGWLFGWNQYEGADFNQDLDFSFTRVLIPTQETLYSNDALAHKFRVIADWLDKEDNQLIITPTYGQDTFDSHASFGYYYLPV